MTSAFFSGEILSKELMENVGTIFNIGEIPGARPCVQQRVYNPAGGNPVK